jgi:hypothetical protein
MIETMLAREIVEFAQDLWAKDPRANGYRPSSESINLQLHYHNGWSGQPPWWHAACATRPGRLRGRWRTGEGPDPGAALRALAHELGMSRRAAS